MKHDETIVAADAPLSTRPSLYPAPFAARNTPEFNGYFNALWQELEVHVEG